MKKLVTSFASLSLPEYLVLLGVLMVAIGSALVYVPAGLIVAGLFVIGLSLFALVTPDAPHAPADQDVEL